MQTEKEDEKDEEDEEDQEDEEDEEDEENEEDVVKLIDRLILQIVYLVKDAGYRIYHTKSEVYPGSYSFYIIDDHIIPSKSKIVSSVSVILTWETLLQTPRTRSQQTIDADTFYIQLVETNPDPLYRHKGWATLLLMYTISYLQKLYPKVKIFTLKDESPQNTNIKDGIYNNMGFIPMHIEAMNMTKKNITDLTDKKKY